MSIIFPDTFAQFERVLKADAAIVVGGVVEQDDGHTKIIAEQIRAAEDMFKQIKRITLDVEPAMEPKLALVRAWAEKFPGDTALCLRLHLPELKKTVELDIKDFRGIMASSEALDGLLRLGIPLGFQ